MASGSIRGGFPLQQPESFVSAITRSLGAFASITPLRARSMILAATLSTQNSATGGGSPDIERRGARNFGTCE